MVAKFKSLRFLFERRTKKVLFRPPFSVSKFCVSCTIPLYLCHY
ncbi:hypothetical protein GCWU000325_01306 [Alloprevotella tannerae ATCC 51259]|uniref:Uncharacterized protein n=1 Tax=Alloprevotella tannerae ATCC 51259 TaxID=626522 RepID=C9LGG3_9BACT|nr:hypothetical protein GCWU000325_01306 [Alloprevotella tannerae ATCC 51259]